jgi:putative hydrolase of the HAD superfamily
VSVKEPAAIRVVLFDYGGVLAAEGFRDGLRALAREQDLDADALPRQAMQAVYDSGFVLGRGSATNFWRLLRERSGLQGADAELSARILAGFRLRPAMIDLVRRLRTAGYRTGILSDQTHWLDELAERQQFAMAFDRIYNSYHLGKGKRDASLFVDVADDLGVPPRAILFVDDDPGNIERARSMGLQTLLFSDQRNCLQALQPLLDLSAPGPSEDEP